MTKEDFNLKYKDYLEEGFYGLSLSNPDAIKYLDKKFEILIKKPNFKYIQIKLKFNRVCFYANGLTREEIYEIENNLTKIYEIKGFNCRKTQL